MAKSVVRELAKPYQWIRDFLPIPRFSAFLQESLAVAPNELRGAVLEAYVRAGGGMALPALVEHDMTTQAGRSNALQRFVAYHRLRSAAQALTGHDLGEDTVAWEQEVRRRWGAPQAIGSAAGGD